MAGGAGGGGGGGGGGKTSLTELSALVDLTGDSDDERSRGSESATLEQAFVRQRVEAHEGAFLEINSVNAQFEELHKTAPSGSRLSQALLRAGQDANVQVEKIVGRQAGCSTRYMNLRLKMPAADADDLLCGSSSISSPQSAGSKRPLDLAHSSADSGASRAIAAPVPKRSSVKPQTSDGEKEPEQPNALKDELASKNRVCALLPLCVCARRVLHSHPVHPSMIMTCWRYQELARAADTHRKELEAAQERLVNVEERHEGIKTRYEEQVKAHKEEVAAKETTH